MSDLDPRPWVHHERAGDYRDSVGPDCVWGCFPSFLPRPEFEQDQSKYLVDPGRGEPEMSILYSTPTRDGAMVITVETHSCGWPERITYLDAQGEIVRSGCAGCDQEWDTEAVPETGQETSDA